MPNNPVARDANGNYIRFDESAGNWRPLTADEYSNLSPRKVLNEMGVDKKERFTFKNLTRNPQLGIEFLKGLPDPRDPSKPKYEVHRYGDGFNAAVRPFGSNEPFKLVDPSLSASPVEFLRDLADLTSDLFKGAAAGVGATAGTALGGPVGGAAGGAAGAMSAELMTQSLGEAMGVPRGNAAPLAPETIIQGIGGAAGGLAEPVLNALGAGILRPVLRAGGRVAGKTIEGLRSLSEEAVGKVMGIKPLADLSVAQTLLERNARTIPLPTPEMALDIIRGHLELAKEGHGSIVSTVSRLRNEVVESAESAGARIDLTGFRPMMKRAIGKAGVEFGDPNILLDPAIRALNEKMGVFINDPTREQAAQVLASHLASRGITLDQKAFTAAVDTAHALLKRAHARYIANVEPKTATALLDQLGQWLRDTKASFMSSATETGAPQSAARTKVREQVERLYGRLSEHIKGTLDSKGFTEYRSLQAELKAKLDAHQPLRDVFGYRQTPAQSAESAVVNAMRGLRSDLRDALHEYDHAFSTVAGIPVDGPKFANLLHEVALGSQFTPEGVLPYGKYGVPGFIPKLGSTGTSRAAGLIGGVSAPTVMGAGVGAAVAGMPGAVVGGAAGTAAGVTLGSPKIMVALAPRAVRAADAAARVAAAAARGTVPLSALAAPSRYALALAAGEAKANMGKHITEERAPGRSRSGRPRRMVDLTR